MSIVPGLRVLSVPKRVERPRHRKRPKPSMTRADAIGWRRTDLEKIARILLANPQTIVFIGLNRGSGQEDFGGDRLTKQRDRALCPTSTDRLFSENYYDNDFCSEKYVRIACPGVRCSWSAGSGILRTPTVVMPPPPQQKDVRDVATPSYPGACA
jgi:hypothetical protein